MNYDSLADTNAHQERVRHYIGIVCAQLTERGRLHDDSKTKDPEKAIFDEYTPKLRGSTYGSDQYKEMLAGMGTALKHHYEVNSHHPEHFPNGIAGMNLIDLLEMFCDWKAATERHADGSLPKSVEINAKRFGMDPQVAQILRNSLSLF